MKACVPQVGGSAVPPLLHLEISMRLLEPAGAAATATCPAAGKKRTVRPVEQRHASGLHGRTRTSRQQEEHARWPDSPGRRSSPHGSGQEATRDGPGRLGTPLVMGGRGAGGDSPRQTCARSQGPGAPWEGKRPCWTKQTTRGAWLTFAGSPGPSVEPGLSLWTDGGKLPRGSEQKRKRPE